MVFTHLDRFVEDGEAVEESRNATKTETGGMLTIVWGVVCAFLLIWMLYQGANAPPVVKTDLVFTDVEKPTSISFDLSADYDLYVYVRKEKSGAMDLCATEMNATMTAMFPQAAAGVPQQVPAGMLEMPVCNNPGWQWHFQAVSKKPNCAVTPKTTCSGGYCLDSYFGQAWSHSVMSAIPQLGEARPIMAKNRDIDLNNIVNLNEGATPCRAGVRKFVVQMQKQNGQVQFAGTGEFPTQAGGTSVYGDNTDMLYGTRACAPTVAKTPDGNVADGSAGGECFKDAQCPYQPYTQYGGNAGFSTLKSCGPSGCIFGAYGQYLNTRTTMCSDPVSWSCGQSTCIGGKKMYAFKDWNNGSPMAHTEMILSFTLPSLYQSVTTSSAFNFLEIIGSWGGQVGILTTVFALFKKLLAKGSEKKSTEKRPSREAEMTTNPAQSRALEIA